MIKWLKWMIDRSNASPDNEANREAGLRWLFSFIRPQRNAIILVLLLSVLASAMVLLQPWLTKMLIDDGLLAKDYSMLLQLSGLMIAIGIFNTGLSGFNRYCHTKLSGQILFALREDLYQHLQKLSPTFYAQRRIGDLLSRMDVDVAQIQRFAVDALFASVSSVLGLLGAISMMLILSWQLSLMVVVLIPLEVIWLRWMRRKVEQQARGLRERSADLSSFLVETLPVMKFIQSVGQEPRESHRLQQFGGQYLDQLLILQVVEFFTHALPSTLTSCARAGVFLIGGYWVIEGQWQLGALIAFSTYLGMALGPVQSLLGLYVAIQKMVVSLDRVAELRQQPVVVDSLTDTVPLSEHGVGTLKLEQVSFCHHNRTEAILREVSLEIKAGLKVAISGASGAGKSTFIDLLQRHYDPDTGRILFDGVDLRRCHLAELRRRIAVVSQDIVLFRGSLLDNLRYACPSATDEQVKAAAIQAQLGELIAALPQGLLTPLGERGQQLSGGQKQRIAIARALLQQPKILILDEATSAVDEHTEQEIIQAVDQLFSGRTRILISHRQSTLQDADLYLKLEQGQLTEYQNWPQAQQRPAV
ncbi:ATP-binding cassette, subfamily B [Oceanospirillum multiglobuliferum]|uniref:ABC transporter ATP-binding protein n=1 Tax=Oceanospirillum multiglobuliferum TaxID=64969 RepID=A0A1T4P3M3_9GAMM|nr:ABC transporter ATP-binding protein [Oceanospirillum multiglobuliferum]OPX55118.1 ABC transporter ATP-binding protein [Oceanospirillum multiglobuliferum]SJZ85907.1 ATP-binding cassette, subfamily B [Oceanospirillum multiglobuliferum]